MAKTGVASQLTADHIRAPREGNLFEPVDRDPGAHGRFGERAHRHSLLFWVTKHRRTLGGAAAVATARTAAAALRS
jgi:hypothetical protein